MKTATGRGVVLAVFLFVFGCSGGVSSIDGSTTDANASDTASDGFCASDITSNTVVASASPPFSTIATSVWFASGGGPARVLLSDAPVTCDALVVRGWGSTMPPHAHVFWFDTTSMPGSPATAYGVLYDLHDGVVDMYPTASNAVTICGVDASNVLAGTFEATVVGTPSPTSRESLGGSFRAAACAGAMALPL